MTENGDPYENALAERMNRTIKEEMLQNRRFVSFEAAEAAIAEAIADYNNELPHASLNFLTPQHVHQFEIQNLNKKWKKRQFKQQQNPTPPQAVKCRA